MPTNMPASAKATMDRPRPPMARPPMERPRPAVPAPGGKKAAAFGLVGLLVGLAAGYGVGRMSTGTSINPLLTSKGGSYQDGYNAAKKKIDDTHLFPQAQTTATALVGTIKSVGADSIVVSVALSSPNPLDEMKAPVDRTVKIDASTKISRQKQKTPEESQKDFAKFQADMTAGKTGITPPTTFTIEAVKLSDLKVGDLLTVVADHDILNETSFTATEMSLVQNNAPTLTLPPPPTTPQVQPPGPGTP